MKILKNKYQSYETRVLKERERERERERNRRHDNSSSFFVLLSRETFIRQIKGL
jgi:hypothetical protein